MAPSPHTPTSKSQKLLLPFLLLLLLSTLTILLLYDDVIPYFSTQRMSPLSIPHPPTLSNKTEGLIPQSSNSSTNGDPSPPPPPRRPKPPRRASRDALEALRSTPKSRLFSTRARRFFGRSCSTRFFMTWFSPLDSFTPRELLVVESLFRAHGDACLLFLSGTLDSPEGRRILRPFRNLGLRITALTPDYPFLLRGTPAERWLERLTRGLVPTGVIPLGQNLSNLVRLAALYRYGGTYVDTDVVVMRSFRDLRNVVGAQSVDVGGNWTRLNNAVLAFDRGHPVVREFIREFAEAFDGSRWGHNGPYLVTRVVERWGGVRVVGPEAFYPVGWVRIGDWFRSPRDGRERRWVKERVRRLRERSYGVHLWNRESKRLVVEEGSVLATIIWERCLLCNYSYFSSSPSSSTLTRGGGVVSA